MAIKPSPFPVFYAPPIILECMVPMCTIGMDDDPMCTIGMDGPHVYNRDGWSPCVQ